MKSSLNVDTLMHWFLLILLAGGFQILIIFYLWLFGEAVKNSIRVLHFKVKKKEHWSLLGIVSSLQFSQMFPCSTSPIIGK